MIYLLTFHIARGHVAMAELCAELYYAKRLQYLAITRGYPEYCAMHFPSEAAAQAWADLHEGEIGEVQTCALEMQGV